MPTQILVPDLGESVVEATVLRWLKQAGERVDAGETVVELETDKVNLEVSAPNAGILASIAHQAGEDVRVGDVLGTIQETPMAQAPKPTGGGAIEHAVASAPEQTAPVTLPEAQATPVAQRMADTSGIDLRQIPPSSADGRITKHDVENYLAKQQVVRADAPLRETTVSNPAPIPPREISALQAVDVSARANREERVRMSRRRQTIARRLVQAQQTAAILTTFNEADMSGVMELRKQRKETFHQRFGVNLGLMSFFVKAVIGALKSFPRLNAEIQDDEIVFKHYYDIGIAVGAEEGLVVPVLRDADRMSFAEIENKIKEFSTKAQDGTLSLDDLRGGTFTITNGGVFGSLLSAPILNPPQVGILGMHKIEDRPIARDGQVVIRPMMYLALSYDHRLVDGREAVQFLVRVKELLQDPVVLLLEGG
ncbi:MAG: dihydrolipoamide succinyltransferase [Chloroflexi bacterium UTCFX4]|nr:MAG: dihydrolipoamide succinyltransferase [Chloroflexi bacterium UTCFX4]